MDLTSEKIEIIIQEGYDESKTQRFCFLYGENQETYRKPIRIENKIVTLEMDQSFAYLIEKNFNSYLADLADLTGLLKEMYKCKVIGCKILF